MKNSQSNSTPNLPKRQQELKTLLTDLCRSLCEERDLAYVAWERTNPVDGSAPEYFANGGDGFKNVRIPLGPEAVDLMRRMEVWTKTGEGACPADEWRAKQKEAAQSEVESPTHKKAAGRRTS